MTISAALSSVVERVKVRGAMSPILWLVATLTVTAAVTSFSSNALMQYVMAGCVVAAVSVALYAFVRWVHVDPDRLQSESYRLEDRKLTLLGDEKHPAMRSALEAPKMSMLEAVQAKASENPNGR